jgi:hypothetical protein
MEPNGEAAIHRARHTNKTISVAVCSDFSEQFQAVPDIFPRYLAGFDKSYTAPSLDKQSVHYQLGRV